MGYLKFEKTELINLESSLQREVIRSNRAGSYASTTLVQCNTRKYHGLLVCPLDQFEGENYVLLSNLDVSISQDGNEFNLGIHKYKGDLYIPAGHKYIREYDAEIIPRATYRVGSIVLIREILLVENEQQFLVKYTVAECDHLAYLKFTPFLAFRNVHKLSKANMYVDKKIISVPNGIKCRMYNGFPYLHMQLSKKNEFIQKPDWYYNVEYLEEQRRGYDFKEDLYVPGYFETTVKKGDVIIFSASTVPVTPEHLKRKFASELSKRTPRNSFRNCLVNAAEQFIKKNKGKTEVIAGFPWFGSWGRDTFIALPGLTLSRKDFITFKAVLSTSVKKLKFGLFPNMGSDDNPAFNSVDAPLWFFWALKQYVKVRKNHLEVWKEYGKYMKNILQNFRSGTLFNIHMTENGLLYAGAPGKALTWMDAVVNGNPVTPRTGFAVDINALWYSAITFSLDLAQKANDKKFLEEWSAWPEKIKAAFEENFWDNKMKYLADFTHDSYKDWSIRPNQIIAASVDKTLLDSNKRNAILEIVKKNLLTPRGLRTLYPEDENYKGIYQGNQEERDEAYHQGTVWPWLLEHYCKVYLDIHGKSGLPHIKKIIEEFEPVMSEHGIGTISEIYDGNPPYQPRGAISQAWSVAALLRIIDMIEEYEKKKDSVS